MMIPSFEAARLRAADSDLARFLGALALAGLFAAMAFWSIELTRLGGHVAVVWLPNAIAAAILLRMGGERPELFLVAICIASGLVNTGSGMSAAMGFTMAAANTVEIAIVLLLAGRYCGDPIDTADAGVLARFALFVGVPAALASTAIAMIALSIGEVFSLASVLRWFVADALGMIVVVPVALILIDALRGRVDETHATGTWMAVGLPALALVTLVFVQTTMPLLFLAVPAMLVVAFRLGTLGTALATVAFSFIATMATMAGRGPLVLMSGELPVKLTVLQLFIAGIFLCGLPVAAVLRARFEALRDLRTRERQLDLLTRNITDAVLHYDAAGLCTYASPSATNVLGVPPETFIGKAASARMHPDARDAILDAERRLLGGEVPKLRMTYRRFLDDARGDPVWIEADCAVTEDPESGAISGLVVSARDVTERVRLEEDLGFAREHAEAGARTKSRFLANMSHEIRTPMNGVLGFADLLQRSRLDAVQRQQVDMIVDSGSAMMRILNDLLDVSKIEAGQLEIIEEPLSIEALLRDCLRLERPRADAKGLLLECEIDAAMPERIVGDADRLRQVIGNLLSNAVKFTSEGGVRLVARARRARGDDPTDMRLTIAIEDTGAGIAPELCDAIFNPFEQEDNTISRRFGGTGLGLAISREIAELLGGSLTVDSVPGLGSRFVLTLGVRRAPGAAACAPVPRHTNDDPPAPARDTEEDRNPSDALFRAARDIAAPRILLAEDHDVNRMLMTAMLERCGMAVSVAHDGGEAIEAALAAEDGDAPFDLVLMDVQMPRCDGYSAARAIRDAGISGDRLPIVALTANAFPEDVRDALASGMQAHLAKPVSLPDLARTLRRWLPARIVAQDSGPDASDRSDGADPKTDRTPGGAVAGPDLVARYRERREEAIGKVGAALDAGSLDGTAAEELAQVVHKLAGTAGMFGEEGLGERARNFERALRSEVPDPVRRALAQELLDLA